MAPTTIPILPSADFDDTYGFYARLGFDEVGRWPDEYLILRHRPLGIELHFWSNPNVDRWTNDVACYVRFETPSDAVSCHGGWSDVVIDAPATLSSPDTDEHGNVEFNIIDLHGNLVRLGGFAAR